MRGQSKNWKLYTRSATKPTRFLHLSSYATQAAAEKAVPAKFGNTRPAMMYEIVLAYLGQIIKTWKNPNK